MERRHGRVKRGTTVVEFARKLGWDVQCAPAEQNARANAPHLNADAAMILVGAALPEASRAATRDEVEAAFDYLTNPLVAQAVHLPDNSGIVILN